MNQNKEKAFEMRETGKSYSEIYRKLGVPKSTLATWFKNESFSKAIKEKLISSTKKNNRIKMIALNTIRGLKLKEYYRQAKEESLMELELFRHNPLFVAGIMLYWGEGDKVTKHQCRIANSDPAMIRLFVRFLEEICGVSREKMRAGLLLYPDHNINDMLLFWRKEADIANISFFKPSIILGKNGSKKKSNGVCSLSVHSSYLKRKIVVWVDGLAKEMNKEEYYK